MFQGEWSRGILLSLGARWFSSESKGSELAISLLGDGDIQTSSRILGLGSFKGEINVCKVYQQPAFTVLEIIFDTPSVGRRHAWRASPYPSPGAQALVLRAFSLPL